MGDWTVLKYWNSSGDGYHDWHESERANSTFVIMQQYKCHPVVEEHQEVEETPTAPEFVISVAYQRGLLGSIMKSDAPGWRWTICWNKRDGRRGMCTGYGLQTPESAKAAAEFKAGQIALSELPEEVYTYTPEI